MEENKVEYVLGVLETTVLLLSAKNPEVLELNIEHLSKILPIVIEELKGQ
jgi:hypothetical protein